MDRRLIITADDLGVNAQRSHGIFQACEFGVVTNASLIPNVPESETAARHARERGVATGLKLTLTSEYPLSAASHIPGLTEHNGLFLEARKFFPALQEGRVPRASLERELRSQLEWFFDAHGLSPSHICSQDDVHLHPAVYEVLIPFLDRYGVRHVRIPCELPLPPFGYEITEPELVAAQKRNERALAAKAAYLGQGLVTTDHFRGTTLHGNASLKNMRHIVARLPEGVTELVTHPGSPCAYGTPFDLDPQRQTELRMVLDESVIAELAERKIMRVTWNEL
jgi:chitin disaccharide deacetylase